MGTVYSHYIVLRIFVCGLFVLSLVIKLFGGHSADSCSYSHCTVRDVQLPIRAYLNRCSSRPLFSLFLCATGCEALRQMVIGSLTCAKMWVRAVHFIQFSENFDDSCS